MNRPVLAISLILLSAVVVAASSAIGTSFLALMRSVRKDVQWDAASAIVGDVDGDGKPDVAAVGYLPGEVVLAIRATTASNKVNFLNFGVNPGAQNALCSVPATLSSIPLSCQSNTVPLPGCKDAPNALALVLGDRDCGAMNLYWNHDEHRLAWWRD